MAQRYRQPINDEMTMKAKTVLVLRMTVATALSVGAVALADNYPANGYSGFGGPLGLGSLTLTDNGTTISGTFNRGSGAHNDTLVIYIDSVSGGLSDTSLLNDGGDDLRRAISGFDGGANRSTVIFPSGFQADYAIALHNNNFTFGGLWQLINNPGNNGLPFVTSVNLSGGGTTQPAYTFDFDWSEIGLGTASSFKFVATYVSNTGYRSNEAIGESDADPSNNYGWTTMTFNGFRVYPVPEPSTVALAGLAALALFGLRKRG